MNGPLRRALDDLAAEIAGEAGPDPGHTPRDGFPDGSSRGSPAAAADGSPDGSPDGTEMSRSRLLRGAALLTGRGDLAQDATHVGTSRARLASGGRPGRTQLCGEVLRAVRSRPPLD